jgi:uncharacterized membrane protein YhhN
MRSRSGISAAIISPFVAASGVCFWQNSPANANSPGRRDCGRQEEGARTMPPAYFVLLCGLAVGGLLFAEKTDSAGLRAIFKPLASLAFIAAGLAAGALESPFGIAVLVGLVLCALGDVLLIPRDKRSFLAGMAAFAAGHGAYIAAFLIGGVAMTPTVAFTALAAAAFSIGLVVWLWKDLKEFKVPVAAYATIISVMVAASIAHYAADPLPANAQFAAAAAGFALSDVAVARDQFQQRAFVNRLWGLPLYFAAQCLFAVSI